MMPKRSVGRISSPSKRRILLLLKEGSVLLLRRSAAKQWHLLTSLPETWRRINRRVLQLTLRDFYSRRLVDYREDDDGIISLTLSDLGKRRVLEFDLEKLTIKRPKRWDGIWRLVLFDVPEKRRQGRDALREKLRELGFYEWQKSAFVFPHECRNEVDFVVEVFDLRPFVRYGELRAPTNEAELKLVFGLA